MIKFVGCILIITSSTIVGFRYAEHFRKRVKELKEIHNSLYELRNEIIYTHTPLVEAFKNISDRSNYPVNLFFKLAAENLCYKETDNVYSAFKCVFDTDKFQTNLNNDDKKILLNLSKSLGETDIEGQVKVFELAIKNIENHITEAEEIMKKNVKMYRCLGFCVGAMITIMIV
ncbi:stage III sporulation protein AB [Clostridium acetobutylicum]|uniref:Stage III sporulation protein AB, SpoIIIAB n=1 Tax=Clostridium acetobutylicum (strain ATCC 824 / DSM 792 / JCM 1419 / IAM 19013 / LMG 5710 / NBRC 13948 / NRRL B-527 / VKM B-1787 / 2291 / W) TaxID=272562 RepID=Q97HC0_CLOAB|nr:MULTISPECIES: stage III sporulation protein SpoIIIAB [Clostridium]AAK80051.1 Stage III sporulation protein AB, SpoIIIAB [Clostridium acetobutylicum ATCC 824]ADZ21143.1 stage III sporulation protein SpoAB [Clostridium acetobutylicum EA 2018]AEI34090.1 stage III sporulation protein SpoAB [Clostridium acetobutylicum DSM 1731]AWV79521.1 stage III sporulation protein SpoAB [Clostridium acetobutylicum]MBC2394505.1 stage III sporulation protein SpoAB [Clostridium acetobutylicum]